MNYILFCEIFIHLSIILTFYYNIIIAIASDKPAAAEWTKTHCAWSGACRKAKKAALYPNSAVALPNQYEHAIPKLNSFVKEWILWHL